MKRIYRELASGGKELLGYDYEGTFIELDWIECNSLYNPWRRYGYLVEELRPILGYCWFETLKEAKEYIDKYLKK